MRVAWADIVPATSRIATDVRPPQWEQIPRPDVLIRSEGTPRNAEKPRDTIGLFFRTVRSGGGRGAVLHQLHRQALTHLPQIARLEIMLCHRHHFLDEPLA